MSVSLRVLARLPGSVVSGGRAGIVVSFPAPPASPASPADQAHLVFIIGRRDGPANDAVLVYAEGGLVGSVAFFAHDGHIGHGATPFRLPLPQIPAGPSRVSFTPIGYPGRPDTGTALEVVATLELVLSTVD
jgi:hypothetical protein